MSNRHSLPDMSKETLELLWARVRQRGDLPGFSKVAGAILGAMRGEDDCEFNLTKTVLSDPALTQKVLRLANSPMYSVFGHGVNTVSKAVIVLGTDAIGHLALGLKLADGLSAASADSINARNEMEKALLASHIARQIASCAGVRDVEEVVVCSMLHSLGRMMVAFYLSERWALVQTRCADGGLDEHTVAREILGIGMDEIGRLVAQDWGLPALLVDSLKDVSPKSIDESLSHDDWLAAVSTMSSRCAVLLHENQVSATQKIAKLADGYAGMLGLDASQLLVVVESARKTAEEEAVFVRPGRLAAEAGNGTTPFSGKPANAAQLLISGVADVRDASGSLGAAQLLTMALETVYKSLGFSHAIAFLRNPEGAKYTARMCFGEGAQELMPHLSFPDAYQPDVFHAALANDKMIFVENAHDHAFTSKLPRWWKETLSTARSFLVLPVTINHQSAGFIYGDWSESLPPTKIEAAEVAPLQELRALIAQTMDYRRRTDFNSTAPIF